MTSRLWWLSFCDPGRPPGSQFLGACVVPGADMASAVMEARRTGCNPGGEVAGQEVPAFLQERLAPRAGRLMGREECEALDGELLEVS